MAQSNEGRLVKQMGDALGRVDINVYQVASGTCEFSPAVKANLVRLIIAIANVNQIEWSNGYHIRKPEDAANIKFLAGLHRYVTGLDSPFDDW